MTPGTGVDSVNEKAASRAAIDWQSFRARFLTQFLLYGAFVTVSGTLRACLGQIGGFYGFLAWEAIYLPLAAVLAAVLAYRAKD